jgi:excisionase family DNA binding protein
MEDSMTTQAIPIRLENEEEAQVVRQLYRMLIHDGTAALVGPDDSKIALPPTIYKVLVAIMKDMQEGKSIGLIPVMEELSTQAAADMLGVSRQFLVNELEAGKLAFHRTGTHRKMYLKDLLAYQEQRGMNRKDAIRRIAQASEELGIYNQFVPFDE